MGYIIEAILFIIGIVLIIRLKLEGAKQKYLQQKENEIQYELTQTRQKVDAQKLQLQTDYNTLRRTYEQNGKQLETSYQRRKTEINQNITDLQSSISQQVEYYKQAELQRVQLEMQKAADAQKQKLKLEYDSKFQLAADDFTNYINSLADRRAELGQELLELQSVVEDFRAKRTAINEAILREKELQDQTDFYRIQLSPNDQQDIAYLRQIEPQIRNKEAISKLIYEVYIKKPLTEMIKRVTSNRAISGIYKITYIKTGECYIGRTTNIATRWTNHAKTTCGLDGCAHSTLHTRMAQDGIDNYTFEILEEVPTDLLNEREKYYIDLYQSITLLNMKAGG